MDCLLQSVRTRWNETLYGPEPEGVSHEKSVVDDGAVDGDRRMGELRDGAALGGSQRTE